MTSQQPPPPLNPSVNQPMKRTWLLLNWKNSNNKLDLYGIKKHNVHLCINSLQAKKLKPLFDPTFPSFLQSSAF